MIKQGYDTSLEISISLEEEKTAHGLRFYFRDYNPEGYTGGVRFWITNPMFVE